MKQFFFSPTNTQGLPPHSRYVPNVEYVKCSCGYRGVETPGVAIGIKRLHSELGHHVERRTIWETEEI